MATGRMFMAVKESVSTRTHTHSTEQLLSFVFQQLRLIRAFSPCLSRSASPLLPLLHSSSPRCLYNEVCGICDVHAQADKLSSNMELTGSVV